MRGIRLSLTAVAVGLLPLVLIGWSWPIPATSHTPTTTRATTLTVPAWFGFTLSAAGAAALWLLERWLTRLRSSTAAASKAGHERR